MTLAFENAGKSPMMRGKSAIGRERGWGPSQSGPHPLPTPPAFNTGEHDPRHPQKQRGSLGGGLQGPSGRFPGRSVHVYKTLNPSYTHVFPREGVYRGGVLGGFSAP